MPLQHYLPATFLASFSTDTTGTRRERILAAGDKISGNVFSARASNLAGENDLYTLTSSQMNSLNPLLVDQSLSGYESNLSIAIEQLIQHEITAMTWATVLVPFISGLLVRGPDFNTRFDSRIAHFGIEVTPDNTNMARLMEFQRLLAPIAVAKWILLSINSDNPMITNDIGHAPFLNPNINHFGMAVPIGLSHILVVVPTPNRILAYSSGGAWHPTIEYLISPGQNHIDLNRVMATRARRFIFGSDTSTINKYISFRGDLPPLEPPQMGFISGFYAMVHDMDWYKLVSALSMPPKSDWEYLYLNLLSNHRKMESS